MRQTRSAPTSDMLDGQPRLRFHHLAVQTNDLENSLSWYEEFLGCQRQWSLDEFSELTRSRLPGIRVMAEVAVGDLRLHLFERPGQAADPAVSAISFQHLCLRVGTEADLVALRQRWIDLYACGRYTFALDEPPTPIVVDSDGVRSFYTYDVNGLEFEFTHMPIGMS